MTKHYLEVAYRKGKAFATYFCLDRRADDRAVRSERSEEFVVDYAADGRVMGIELIRLSRINLPALNQILSATQWGSLASDDLAPLSAA